MSAMDVTVFIRTKNEEALIKDCLASIYSQDFPGSVEVILLDSGSQDKTVLLAKNYPLTIYQIPSSLFTYASALNAGMTLSRGKFFVPISAHCIPTGPTWLRELITPLLDIPSAAASYSRQLPWPEASIPEILAVKRTFRDVSHISTPESFRLALAERRDPTDVAILSNTAAAFRRDILLRYPFREVPFSEDRCCAIELLQSGFSILYVATSTVWHLHYPSFREFRTIARDAVRARYMINNTIVKEPHKEAQITLLLLVWYLSKIPLSLIWVALTLPVMMLPGRKSRLRELRWRFASIGTTIGKFQGLLIAKKELGKVASVASEQRILEALTEVSTS